MCERGHNCVMNCNTSNHFLWHMQQFRGRCSLPACVQPAWATSRDTASARYVLQETTMAGIWPQGSAASHLHINISYSNDQLLWSREQCDVYIASWLQQVFVQERSGEEWVWNLLLLDTGLGPYCNPFPLNYVQVENVVLGTQMMHSLESKKHQIDMERDKLTNKCWSEPQKQ